MAEYQEMIDATKARIREYLSEVDPEFQEYESGMFTVQEGSAVVGITIRPWHDDDVVVEFTSQLVNGAAINGDTMRWLLQKNAELHFGAFGLLFDNTILYSHTIPGGSLNKKTFAATARMAAVIADHYDDEIVGMAGGTLASAGTSADDPSPELQEAS